MIDVRTFQSVEIEYDPINRDVTLVERGLDLADPPELSAVEVPTLADERVDYLEPRYQTSAGCATG